jgi:DNA-binding response OmpR family regulator
MRPAVLVVEDDPASADAIGTLLRHIGYEVVVAGTLGEGRDRLDPARQCCVILDLMLPDGNGVTLLRHIRKLGLRISVLVVHGGAAPAWLDQMEALAPEGVFQKPGEIPSLFAWMRTHLGAHRQRRGVA